MLCVSLSYHQAGLHNQGELMKQSGPLQHQAGTQTEVVPRSQITMQPHAKPYPQLNSEVISVSNLSNEGVTHADLISAQTYG